MDVFDAIQKRFSYRGTYEEKPVPREDLRKIVDAGLLAPSGCNMQTTHIVALDDPGLLSQTGQLLKSVNFASAPAAILVLSQEKPGMGGKKYHVQDYAAAIENMLLAITALGYASCWVEGHVRYYDDIALKLGELVGAPKGYSVVAYLPVGIAAEEGTRAEKLPFSERCGYNKFMGE